MTHYHHPPPRVKMFDTPYAYQQIPNLPSSRGPDQGLHNLVAPEQMLMQTQRQGWGIKSQPPPDHALHAMQMYIAAMDDLSESESVKGDIEAGPVKSGPLATSITHTHEDLHVHDGGQYLFEKGNRLGTPIIPANHAISATPEYNLMVIATIFAAVIGCLTLVTLLVIYNTPSWGYKLSVEGDWIPSPDPRPSTISATMIGYPEREIAFVCIVIYIVPRFVQTVGEYWEVVASRTFFVQAGYAVPIENLRAFLSERLNLRISDTNKAYVAAKRLSRAVSKGLAIVTLIACVWTQFFFVLLLAVTSREASLQHKIFTFMFVIGWIFFAFFDIFAHIKMRYGAMRQKVAFYLRIAMFIVGAVGALIILIYFSRDDGQVMVAVGEYILAFAVLTHGGCGAAYLMEAHIAVMYKPILVYSMNHADPEISWPKTPAQVPDDEHSLEMVPVQKQARFHPQQARRYVV